MGSIGISEILMIFLVIGGVPVLLFLLASFIFRLQKESRPTVKQPDDEILLSGVLADIRQTVREENASLVDRIERLERRLDRIDTALGSQGGPIEIQPSEGRDQASPG